MTTEEMVDKLYHISDVLENYFGGSPYTEKEQKLLDNVDCIINYIENSTQENNWTRTLAEIVAKADQYNMPITIKTPLSDGGLEIKVHTLVYDKSPCHGYYPVEIRHGYCKPEYEQVEDGIDPIKMDIEEMTLEIRKKYNTIGGEKLV